MKRVKKREKLIDVAADLFNRRGYHGAGIDQIIAESGIAKTTLYRHFDTKVDLIVAVLQRVDQKYRNELREYVDKVARQPEDKLLATFDFLDTWFRKPTFYGCYFVAATAEYGERPNPIAHESAMHKRLVLAYFEELARAAGLENPSQVAGEINLLHEGATSVAHVMNDSDAANKAKVAAAKIIAAAKRRQ